MNHYILFFAVMLLSVQVKAQTTYPTGVNGCIARWTFDSDETGSLIPIKDVSNNGNDAINTDVTVSAGWKNINGTAGNFNGTSSFGEVAHKSLLNPTAITIVALVKFNGFYSGVCQGNNIIYKGYDYGNTGTACWTMYVIDDKDCFSFSPTTESLNYSLGNLQPIISSPNNYLSANKWYFLAITYDGSIAKLYQQEMIANSMSSSIAPIASVTPIGGLGNFTDNVFIGQANHPTYPYSFNGDMDEVVLFNKALTDSEILGVYQYLYGAPLALENADQANVKVFCTNKVIQCKGDNKIKSFSIIDLNGNLIVDKEATSLYEDMSQYAAQVFMVKVNFLNGESRTEKVVVD